MIDGHPGLNNPAAQIPPCDEIRITYCGNLRNCIFIQAADSIAVPQPEWNIFLLIIRMKSKSDEIQGTFSFVTEI